MLLTQDEMDRQVGEAVRLYRVARAAHAHANALLGGWMRAHGWPEPEWYAAVEREVGAARLAAARKECAARKRRYLKARKQLRAFGLFVE